MKQCVELELEDLMKETGEKGRLVQNRFVYTVISISPKIVVGVTEIRLRHRKVGKKVQ